jgi:hypothetical protein
LKLEGAKARSMLRHYKAWVGIQWDWLESGVEPPQSKGDL